MKPNLTVIDNGEPHMVQALEDALALARNGELKDLIIAYTRRDLVSITDKVFDRSTGSLERLGLAAAIRMDVEKHVNRQ